MVFEKVRDIIAEQLDVDKETITMDTDFLKDLEADSLDAVEIIMALEEEFNIEIPDEKAEEFHEVHEMVEYIESVM
jgi:acyl carrier protein